VIEAWRHYWRLAKHDLIVWMILKIKYFMKQKVKLRQGVRVLFSDLSSTIHTSGT